jgi:hypothetical protein
LMTVASPLSRANRNRGVPPHISLPKKWWNRAVRSAGRQPSRGWQAAADET